MLICKRSSVKKELITQIKFELITQIKLELITEIKFEWHRSNLNWSHKYNLNLLVLKSFQPVSYLRRYGNVSRVIRSKLFILYFTGYVRWYWFTVILLVLVLNKLSSELHLTMFLFLFVLWTQLVWFGLAEIVSYFGCFWQVWLSELDRVYRWLFKVRFSLVGYRWVVWLNCMFVSTLA